MRETLSKDQIQAAEKITHCYQQLSPSNLVANITEQKSKIFQWQHYPDGDIIDKQNNNQYFYHSHPSNDQDRVIEHGHFHIFSRKQRLPNNISPIIVSDKYTESHGEEDSLTHIVAIAMNNYGFPTAFFTVNHWVVLGAWYDAKTVSNLLNNFIIRGPDDQFSLVDQWIMQMLCLFKPNIIELLHQRDAVIASHQKTNPDSNIYYDKELEITSILPITAGET